MQRRAKTLSVLMLLLIGGALVAACGSGCKTAPASQPTSAPPSRPADLMAGSWEGTWDGGSEVLKGRMSASIKKLPDGDYRASFVSEIGFGLTDKSECVFHVTPKAGHWEFEGTADLGILKGGTYIYKGTVDGKDFVCTFDSKFYKGEFRMHRPAPTTATAQ